MQRGQLVHRQLVKLCGVSVLNPLNAAAVLVQYFSFLSKGSLEPLGMSRVPLGAGELSLCLRVLVVFAEDLGLCPSTHVVAHSCL